jgi:hypothetical protein
MVRTSIYIEGADSPASTESLFRKAFRKLFSEAAQMELNIDIKMCGSKSETIKKFLADKSSSRKIILIDLDSPEETRERELNTLQLTISKNIVFFMIQQMEAWILSQPEILNSFYDTTKFDFLANKNPKNIQNPADEIHKISKYTTKGDYHKVKHGIHLLTRLDAKKLEEKFPEDFKRMIDLLQSEL